MVRIPTIIFCMSVVLLVQPEATGQNAEPKPLAKPVVNASIYDVNADAKAEIDAAIARAAGENRRVLIQWGADWCGWCHLLHGVFSDDRAINKVLRYEYELVRVDVDRFDKALDLAETYGAEWKNQGIPYLTILDGEGAAVVNQETGSLEEGRAHDKGKVLAFLEQHAAEPRPASDVLEGAIAEASAGVAPSEELCCQHPHHLECIVNTTSSPPRSCQHAHHVECGRKKILLHFGAPWCGWCGRFEEWLEGQEVADIFGRHFVLAKIDTDRNTGGEKMKSTYTGGRPTGIPWFVILDHDGTVVLTSDSPDGNIGCPWTDKEIAAFGDILAGAGSTISADEIIRLKQLLMVAREKTSSS